MDDATCADSDQYDSGLQHAASYQYQDIGAYVSRPIWAGCFLTRTIAESLAEHIGRSQEPDIILVLVRVSQASSIT